MNLLLIEDSETSIVVIEECLSGEMLTIARTPEQAERLLESVQFDFILLDLSLTTEDGKHISGRQTLERLLPSIIDTPIAVVTGGTDAETAQWLKERNIRVIGKVNMVTGTLLRDLVEERKALFEEKRKNEELRQLLQEAEDEHARTKLLLEQYKKRQTVANGG